MDDARHAKFPAVSCSQCGQQFGPNDSGFSHCDHHELESAVKLARWPWGRAATIRKVALAAFALGYRLVPIDPPADDERLAHANRFHRCGGRIDDSLVEGAGALDGRLVETRAREAA